MKYLAGLIAAVLLAQGGELRFALHDDPKTFDPFLTADESAEAVRYLTEGVLIRVNRLTQQPEPELAESWKISSDGRKIVFRLRRGVRFPDGAPFTSGDVVDTFRKLLDPALHSPIADTFKTGRGGVTATAGGVDTATVEFPAPAGDIERMFDQVAIVSAKAARRPAPGLGPFLIAERRSGAFILLRRNPAYWKRDASGRPLPRVESIRLDIEANRDLEALRFMRGEVKLIDSLTPDLFEWLSAQAPGTAIDAGTTLQSEFLWFNESSRAPLSEAAKGWFRSKEFRRAVSEAVNRGDLCRVVYRGHATPAVGLVSSANRVWFNERLQPDAYDPAGALKRLAGAGFRLRDGVLRDGGGHAVEFSVVTNAGSKTRERMAAMIQQDLVRIGIRLNIVTLDFPSLIERMTRTLNYEACLLGLVNVDADPSELMNVLLSSAGNHPWNPSEKTPATEWEAEIDRLMLGQAATADHAARKASFDRVQEILREQAPVVCLLHPNALAAVSRSVAGTQPAAFFPHTFWDAERLSVGGERAGR